MNRQISAIILSCGAAVSVASAQPLVISGSGATLLENFLRAPASTNDFIDVDGNGTAGSLGSLFPQQLASASINTSIWNLTYRIVGSGNGIAEFDAFATIFERDPMNVEVPPAAIVNRADLFTSTGVAIIPPANPANPGAVPFVPDPANGYLGTTVAGSASAGFTVDFNTADVPVAWFAIQPGASTPVAVPGAAGYGSNPAIALNKDGTSSGQDNILRPLSILNTNVGSPDANTVYEFPIATVPVAAIVNYGVGLEQIRMSDLRTLAGTGRRINGENLVKVTRDSGSGTRNAFMNGVGIDPSHGKGENVGMGNSSSTFDALGPNFLPSNKESSSRLEGTVFNHRLAVGHTGPERGVTSNWLVDGRADVLAIRDDLRGGTEYVRPTRESTLGLDESGNPLANGGNGYTILGPSGISVRGNPRAAAPELGGWGWDPEGFFDGRGPDGVLGTADDETPANNPFATDPAPANPGVSAYVNNILRSLSLFVEVPNALENDFMPGEQLAAQFVLNDAGRNVLTAAPIALTDTAPVPLIANPSLNPALLAFAASNPANALNNPLYDQFNSNRAGRSPIRTSGQQYSEFTDPNALSNASATGASFVTQGNTVVGNNTPLNLRNKVAGDFNGDEARTPADVSGMLAAYNDRIGGPNWVAPAGSGPNNAGTSGSDAVIEILGDFTGDGNFNAADIRYWADGLHLTTTAGVEWDDDNPGADLTNNRAEGFAAVDAAAALLGIQEAIAPRGVAGFGFFRTTLGNPNATYNNGDAAADIAGNPTTPNFNPIGWDRVVDQQDIDYVAANFGDFTDLEQAIFMDMSADMNGDLQVDSGDIDFVLAVLETSIGDFNLDGVVDASDRATIENNIGGTGYANGDFDLDGDVDADDLAAFDAAGDPRCNAADVAPDFGVLNVNDVIDFVNGFNGGLPVADVSPFPAGDGLLNVNDVIDFVNAFNAGCP